MLDARGNGVVDVRLPEFFGDALLNALEELLMLLALRLEALDDLVVADGVENLQRQILQLPLHFLHSQTVGDGGIDLHGLQGLLPLFFRSLVLHGALGA